MISTPVFPRILLLLTVFTVQSSLAQKNRFKGFYINLHSDTVHGYFDDYKQWNYNPKKVDFTSASGTESQLNPSNCLKFHIEGYDTYVSYQGLRLTNPINYGNATADKSDRFDSLSTFLRQIASLNDYRFYVYNDEVRVNLFYSKDDRTFTELLQKAAIVDNVFWQSDAYKSQLAALFPEERLRASIQNLRYNATALTSFVNKQTDTKVATTTRPKKTNEGLVIMGGISQNNLEFREDPDFPVTTKDYPSDISPVVSVGYMISVTRKFERMFWFPQLKVYSFSHTAKTYYNSDNGYPAEFNTFKSSAVLSLGFHFGYNIINNRNVKLSILPGGGVSLFVNNRRIDEYKASANQQRSVTSSMQRSTYLLDIQSMLMLKKHFILWAGYNLPAPVTNGGAEGMGSSFQGGVGFKL